MDVVNWRTLSAGLTALTACTSGMVFFVPPANELKFTAKFKG